MQAHQQRASNQPRMRRVSTIAACLLVWTLILWQATHIQPLALAERRPAIHFVEYWAAGRLQLTGHNPYSPDQLYPLQQSVGLTRDRPEIMWNPPWTLSFVIPFGMLSYPISRLLWLIFHFALILFCANWLWYFYGGPVRHYWIAWAVSFTFFPTLDVLLAEQIPPLILLGLVGFLYFGRRKQWWWAGVFLVLIAIKPQILYLFWIALILWVLNKRCWSLVLSGSAAFFLATSIPLISNPDAVRQYLHLYTIANPGPLDWATSTLGSLLRLLFGPEKWWLPLVPSILGTLWFFLYWKQHRETWDWAERLPLIILVSLATTFFGWMGDQVVLLPAVIQATLWILQSHRHSVSNWPILFYIATNSLAGVMNILKITALWYFWMAPMWLLTYVLLLRKIRQGQ